MNLSYPRRRLSVKRALRAIEGRIGHGWLSTLLETIPRVPPILIFHTAQPLHPSTGPHFSVRPATH